MHLSRTAGANHTQNSAKTEPLSGVRILDLTRLFPFAYSTQMFVDLGADVVKVEPPSGDPGRNMPALFHASNNGKQSLTLNIYDPEGANLLRELCRSADAVIDNYRPGTLDDLGLGHDELAKENRALVSCSVTSYGEVGPRRDQVGHDLNFFGLSGAAMLQDGDSPVFPTAPAADVAVAMFAPFCVVSAILHARQTGIGDHIDIGMSDIAFSMNSSSYLLARSPAENRGLPWPEFISNRTIGYGAYRAKDGLWFTIGSLEPRSWSALLKVLGRTELTDQQLAVGERATQLRRDFEAVFATRTRSEWLTEFDRAGVIAGPVLSTIDAGQDPQYRAREMVFDIEGRPRVGFPARFLASANRTKGSEAPAPSLGEHTRDVFLGLGISDLDREDLASRGVI